MLCSKSDLVITVKEPVSIIHVCTLGTKKVKDCETEELLRNSETEPSETGSIESITLQFSGVVRVFKI